jgi:hypothetical protein
LVAGDTIRLASGLEFSVQKGWMGVYSRRQPDVPFLSQGSETLTLRSRDASGDVESVIAHDSFGGPLAVQATSRTVTITRSGQFVLVETTLPGNSDGYVSFGSSHGDVMTLFDGFWASVRLGSSPAR